jgi:ATP-binding cassette, subfamily C (CFTR/MRP), member 2
MTRVGVLASRFWHKRMLKSVFSAPMEFFETTPSGQLLSRFGKEIETVDRSVPESIGSFLFCFLQIGMSAGALVSVITPAMLIPLALVCFLYVGVMAKFRPAARDMKQVEAKTRSPIYTNFSEAIRGSEIIRSVPGATQLWKAKHRHFTNTNLGVFGSVKALDRWLSMRLETLGNIVVFATTLSSILLSRAGRLKAGSIGWGLTQSLAITGLMAWTVRTLTDLESNMMSVIRVQELTDVDSTESSAVIPKETDEDLYPELGKAIVTPTSPKRSDALVESGWPWHGHVSFCNVSMRYSPSAPLVLNRVSIDVPQGTTLGIVGRTGSGKSSLLLTLFRLVEIEGDGFIKIDGVDIRSVQLRSLRRSLAIIPQVSHALMESKPSSHDQ